METELILPSALRADFDQALGTWSADDNVRRIWERDATLWTDAGEDQWLGWLDIVNRQIDRIDWFRDVATSVRDEGVRDVVVLGMGGSSLCPDLLRATWGGIPGWPALHVLDSTDPAQVRRVEDQIDLRQTLFVVSSKSGGTLETDLFRRYFFDRVGAVVGHACAGRRFMAITDPGSALEEVARRDGYRDIVAGVPSIGGRFSALSDFGMVPAALMGLDVRRLLDRAAEMVAACAASGADPQNPGLVLGLVVGLAARRGHDKLTLVTSPAVAALGAWLEQLIAESTGKKGLGVIPSDGERVGSPRVYGSDRLFVHLRLDATSAEDDAVETLARAGHPVVRLTLRDRYDLGREFFRWEFATAVAGAILGVDPFGQPDVEASKAATRALTDRFEQEGRLAEETPLARSMPLEAFADERNANDLRLATGGRETVEALVAAHLSRVRPGDYFALLAYLDMNASNAAQLDAIRHDVRDTLGVATSVGFGPRFLHSTGQAHKGGPETGVFVQLTCDDPDDVSVPGCGYSFGIVKAAQAAGDLRILGGRGRRIIRIHLGRDVPAGLTRLRTLVRAAVESR